MRKSSNNSANKKKVGMTMVDTSVMKTYVTNPIPDQAQSHKKGQEGTVAKSSSISMTCSDESSLVPGSDHEQQPQGLELQQKEEDNGVGNLDPQYHDSSRDLDGMSVHSTDTSVLDGDSESFGTANTSSGGTDTTNQIGRAHV